MYIYIHIFLGGGYSILGWGPKGLNIRSGGLSCCATAQGTRQLVPQFGYAMLVASTCSMNGAPDERLARIEGVVTEIQRELHEVRILSDSHSSESKDPKKPNTP